jgi:signal transduction histidine kinase
MEALAEGRDYVPQSFEAVVTLRLNGKRRDYLPRILSMRGRGGGVGLAVVLYDVTRFRLMDELKTDLLGTVSHQVKTPMTSVRMVLHLLLEESIGPLTKKQRELTRTAFQDTERLLEILRVLLDLRRIERGASAMEKHRVHPSDLLATVEMRFGESARLKGHRLERHVREGLPDVEIDEPRIHQVFENLIENALQHSPDAAAIRLEAERTGGGIVRFSVVDAGPGVPLEHRDRVFDKFFRCPGEKESGSGLGLAIAKEIVEAHGGTVGVESEQGEGSRFYFTLHGSNAG